MIARRLYSLVFTFLVLFPVLVHAALPAVSPSVRYMSLGDSLAAGYKAQPATKGFAYQLYLNEVFGRTPDTAFDNAAVPGARSSDVLQFQIPQVALFDPTVVTISVGGNDLLTLLAAPDPNTVVAVLGAFGANLTAILENLCIEMPINGEIYLNNLYTIPEIPGADFIVPLFNSAMSDVVASARHLTSACAGRKIAIADVYNAFLGQRGLLLIERYLKRGIDFVEVHPTNKGYRVMEDAYRAVIGR
jgi:lysophospholipase L1-like esterase